MKSKVVHEKQSLLDLAIVNTGVLEQAFELALQNNLSLTDKLEVGNVIDISSEANVDVKNYFKNNKLIPATDYDEADVVMLEGISYWGINYDFIVQ